MKGNRLEEEKKYVHRGDKENKGSGVRKEDMMEDGESYEVEREKWQKKKKWRMREETDGER